MREFLERFDKVVNYEPKDEVKSKQMIHADLRPHNIFLAKGSPVNNPLWFVYPSMKLEEFGQAFLTFKSDKEGSQPISLAWHDWCQDL